MKHAQYCNGETFCTFGGPHHDLHRCNCGAYMKLVRITSYKAKPEHEEKAEERHG